MTSLCKYTKTVVLLFLAIHSIAQIDSIKKPRVNIELNQTTNPIFQNKKKIADTTITETKLEIGGYVSSYYAYYTEDNTTDFVKYPTMGARNNEFGLNMAMISLAYKSKKMRSNVTLHYGDIAESAWPTKYNLIQEANAGIQLIKNVWLDAGIFRSHIGLESTQPRENITSSMSLANVFEPYVLSGAKLTYVLNSKLSVQLNAFNSFNSIIETNKNKLLGASVMFNPTEYFTVTYNFITGNENPTNRLIKQQRYYNNLYATYQKNKITVGAEVNFGLQENTISGFSSGLANMNSSLLVLKHQTLKKLAVYGRAEWFSDKHEILSTGSNMGNFTYGFTEGLEYKPLKNIALSLEVRNLTSDKPNFLYNGYYVNQRWEGIMCLDVWF